MTTDPAKCWGLDTRIAPGADASFLVLDRDPRTDAGALADAEAVWLHGRRVR